jgi:hypothetical protein
LTTGVPTSVLERCSTLSRMAHTSLLDLDQRSGRQSCIGVDGRRWVGFFCGHKSQAVEPGARYRHMRSPTAWSITHRKVTGGYKFTVNLRLKVANIAYTSLPNWLIFYRRPPNAARERSVIYVLALGCLGPFTIWKEP